MRLTREFYIPAQSTKVADKHSDAVAYVSAGRAPRVTIFWGKGAKPVFDRYLSLRTPEAVIADYFGTRQSVLAGKAKKRAERSSIGRKVEVGHVLSSSWGYEQTNVNFYQVVELVGRTQAIIRPIASMSVGDANRPGMTDKVVPKVDAFTGEPRKVIVRDGCCKVGHQHALVWTGQPMFTSSYA